MKKILRVALATILAFAVSLSLTPLAFADDPEPDRYLQAAITKLLQVPIGTEFPDMTFNFSVTPSKFNDTNILTSMPAIGTAGVVSINFTRAAATLEETVGGVSTYYLESAELFGSVAWPSAGKYEYLIKETGTSYVIADPLHEALALSPAEYLITVFVREYKADDQEVLDGLASVGDRYIYTIGAMRIVTEEGEDGSVKVDPTPGGNQINTFYSGMTFNNRYVKTNGAPDPDDPDLTDPDESTLNISKMVEGDLGSLVWLFSFNITVTVPNLIPSYVLPFYKAYVVDASGAVDPAPNAAASLIGTDASGLKYLKFVSGTSTAFKLSHGQKLVFVNTPVGTSYSTTESGEPGYIASVKVTTNGVQGAASTGATGSGISVTGAYVGEAYNSADVINTYDLTPPTGLSEDNLPFYALILLALGSLVAFIAFKRSRRQDITIPPIGT